MTAWDDERWSWLGEALSIDFANTVLRQAWEDVDLLGGAGDVAEWVRRQDGRVPAVTEAQLRRRLADIWETRDDVRAVLGARGIGAPVPRHAAGRLDALARRWPVVAQLGGPPHVAGDPKPVDTLLALVVDDAIRLDVDVGFCDAPSCGQAFTRERRGQKWCGPACGTRARVARHAGRTDRSPKAPFNW